MLQLACFLDGGLCLLAIGGGSLLLGALGIKIGGKGKTEHPHDDCDDCHLDTGCDDCNSQHVHCNDHCDVCKSDD